ncbi:MAG: anthranilate phosphoribosyltransferase [bacterium]
MIKEAIAKLVEKQDLSTPETEQVMSEIMNGEATPAQIAGFLTSLRLKGETVEEITGCAKIMRKFATKITAKGGKVLDTCGTGGDRKNTFNISTLTALVVASAGVIVAKHGNKSVSSKCGSADLLDELGVNIKASKEVVEECIEKVGIGFLFAPLLHGAMKYAMPVRKEMGIRTVFNVLGPLTNPAGANYQLLGVYDKNLVKPLAEVLGNLGAKHALVVHGKDGLDEVTITDLTYVAELKDGKVTTYEIDPGSLGIKKATIDDLKGGEAKENAAIALSILKNEEKGPLLDIVILNAGCALYACDEARDIKEGIEIAKKAIESGKALEKLEALKTCSNK